MRAIPPAGMTPRLPLESRFPDAWLLAACGSVRPLGTRSKVYTVGEIVDRIWAQIDRTGECWLWQGYKRNGYGVISLRDTHAYVHRLMHAIYVGDLGPGLFACHHCDVQSCVRPDHLFAGTAAVNLADMRAKGRERHAAPSGPRNWKFRITDEIVAEVRRIYESERPKQRDLAKRLGITQGTVWAIVNRAGRFGNVSGRGELRASEELFG